MRPQCAILVILVLASSGSWAQIVDGSFESQTPGGGILLQAPWVSENYYPGVLSWNAVEPGGMAVGPENGFPTHGNQWLVVDSFGTGPSAQQAPTDAASGLHGFGTVTQSRQTFTMPDPPIVCFDWTFCSGETTPSISFNDFASIDIVDGTTGDNVINLLYVDTGVNINTMPGATGGPVGTPTYLPCGQGAGSWASFGAEIAPPGPKSAFYDLTGICTPGVVYDIVIVCGNGGDFIMSSTLYVDDFDHDPATCNSGPPPTDQPNSGVASLQFSGASCIPLSVFPQERRHRPGDFMSMVINTTLNGPQPYALFHIPGVAAVTPACLPTPFGLVNLDCAQLLSAVAVINGIAPSTFVDTYLGTTVGAGQLALSLILPTSTPIGVQGSYQALCVDPTNPTGLTLSGATTLVTAAPLAAGLNIGTGATDTLSSNDSSFNLVFTAGYTLPFYGITYTGCFINANGNITFGAADATSLESVSGFLSGSPRIAPFWDDLDPFLNGNLSYTQTAGSLLVTWNGVPEPGGINQQGSNTFGVLCDLAGNVTMEWNGMTADDAIIGVSPGGAAGAVGLPVDLSVNIGSSGGPLDALYEQFTPANPFELTYCLSGPGGPLTFSPLPFTTTPGDGGYVYF